MNIKEKEEFAVMKNEISHIKSDVEDIKTMLKEHTEWEAKKYETLDNKYAPKWTSYLSVGAFLTALSIIVMLIVSII